MPYTTEEGGRLNNFAQMPKMYRAEPPTNNQKRNYIIYGILSVALLGAIAYITMVASNVG